MTTERSRSKKAAEEVTRVIAIAALLGGGQYVLTPANATTTTGDDGAFRIEVREKLAEIRDDMRGQAAEVRNLRLRVDTIERGQ